MKLGESHKPDNEELEFETTREIIAEMARWARERNGWLMRPANASGSSLAINFDRFLGKQN